MHGQTSQAYKNEAHNTEQSAVEEIGRMCLPPDLVAMPPDGELYYIDQRSRKFLSFGYVSDLSAGSSGQLRHGRFGARQP